MCSAFNLEEVLSFADRWSEGVVMAICRPCMRKEIRRGGGGGGGGGGEGGPLLLLLYAILLNSHILYS